MSQLNSLIVQSEAKTTPYIVEFDHFGREQNGGTLTVAQQYSHIPFEIRRLYWIHGCLPATVRGQHSCLRSQQVIMAIAGKAILTLESVSGQKSEFVLDNSNHGIFVPANYWREVLMQTDTILLCFSSIDYDPTDYITDYEVFKAGK